MNNTSAIKLGSAIKRLRRERKLSQQQLANILGISTPYLNLIENNRRNITGKLLITLATEFNIELYKRMQSSEESALRAIGRR